MERKKIALAAVAVLGLGAVALGGLAFGGKAMGEARLRQFFAMARDAEVAQIQAQLAPGLEADADPELAAAFVKEGATRFGGFLGVKGDDWAFQDDLVGGEKRNRSYKGTFQFEKEAVAMVVVFEGERLSQITIGEPFGAQVASDINHVPARTERYQDHGKRFLDALLNGRSDEAFDLMAEPLQQQDGREGFAKSVKTMSAVGGAKTIAVVRAEPRPGTKDRLDVFYRCEGGRAPVEAKVAFQFHQLRGHLVGYGTKEL